MKTIVNFSDVHLPKQNKKALSCVIKTIKEIQPDIVRLNGDIMDCGVFSRHDIYHPPKCHWTDDQFLKESKIDFQLMNQLLANIAQASPKSEIHYALGNHEMWLYEFIALSPQTRQHFSLENQLDLKKYKVKLFPYNSFQKYGKLIITHGIYTGQHHAKKHVDMMGKSILYGHLHDIQVYSKVTPEKDTHMAWCTGCLCDMNPEYLKNKPQNWNHGFAIIYVQKNGNYQVDLKRITKGSVVVKGKCING